LAGFNYISQVSAHKDILNISDSIL